MLFFCLQFTQLMGCYVLRVQSGIPSHNPAMNAHSCLTLVNISTRGRGVGAGTKHVDLSILFSFEKFLEGKNKTEIYFHVVRFTVH